MFHERWEADDVTAVVAMGVGESLGDVGAASRAGSDLDVHTIVNDQRRVAGARQGER